MISKLELSIYAVIGLACLVFITGFSGKKPVDDTIILTEKNTVSLMMPVMEDTIATLERQLLAKSDKLGKHDVIYLVLNTPGGSIDAGNNFIRLAKALPQEVATITIFSASMGFQIVENLGTRYMADNGVLMSHRAAVGGVEGQIPGNAFTRLYFLLEMVTNLDKIASDRAGMGIEDYQAMIKDELWMGPENAVALKFADKAVKVRCDETLRGQGDIQTINLGFFGMANIAFDKCPLITAPTQVTGDKSAVEVLGKSKQELVKYFNY